jgi:hypothetical protein
MPSESPLTSLFEMLENMPRNDALICGTMSEHEGTKGEKLCLLWFSHAHFKARA